MSVSNSVKMRYLEAPEFRNSDAASNFDRVVFACNPNLHHFLRDCFPNELPPGQYEGICGTKERLFKLVVQVFPGFRMAALLARSCEQTPADFCAALEKDPAIAELLRNLRGG